MGEWIEKKRRYCIGSAQSDQPGTLLFKASNLGIRGKVEEFCIPEGFKVFLDGEAYFHGGLSLQEAIIPVVVLRAMGGSEAAVGKPSIEIRYRSDSFTSRVIGLKFFLKPDIFREPLKVRIEAYDNKGNLVGEAADCEARDEITREVTLQPDTETPVPILLDPDFDSTEVEIRVSDPQTRVILARRKLKNKMLD